MVSHEGKDITFWIGKEGATIMSLKSYVKNEAGYETIELMEDSLFIKNISDSIFPSSNRRYPLGRPSSKEQDNNLSIDFSDIGYMLLIMSRKSIKHDLFQVY